MKIWKEGDGWRIDLTVRIDGRDCRIRRTVFGSRRKVEQWVADIRNAAKAGRLRAPEDPAEGGATARPLPFRKFAWEWFETYPKANGNKPSEVTNKEIILRLHLVPFFDNKDMREFTILDVDRYKAAKVTDLSAKTVNNHVVVLKKLFNSAVEWGRMDHNPIANAKKLRAEEYEWDWLNREESEAFLAKCDERWYPFFATLLWTGMRLGEALALRWEDIVWRSETIRVRRSLYRGQYVAPKSGKGRDIPMNTRLIDVLKGLRHLKGELVFCTADGKSLDPANIKRPMATALKRAGLRQVRVHDLRHSFASQMVAAGVPLKAVQELLGHADIKMTLRYSHLGPSDRRNAVETLVLDEGHGKNSTPLENAG